MAIKQKTGFALLISIIFMSVMLAFGLALSSLAYKQQVLSSSAIESQYAFYAADAGLECALYADQRQALFSYPPEQPASAPAITCEGIAATFPSAHPTGIVSYDEDEWVVTERLSLDDGNACADITVVKPNGSGTHRIFSQGYNISCDTVANPGTTRYVARGISVRY